MLTATARRVMEFTERLYLGILTTVYPSGGPRLSLCGTSSMGSILP